MSKYILLECNRIRSKNNLLLDDFKDEFKNTWINQVSSSGIVINAGDTIQVEESIVNSRGASDEVIEFRGVKNESGFLDNKIKLSYSFYINDTGMNTAKLPLIKHRTYRGNGRDGNNNTTLTPQIEDDIDDSDKNNGPIKAYTGDIYLENYSKRSIGETFFYPFDASNTADKDYGPSLYAGMQESSMQAGNYLLRLVENQKGGSTSGAISEGYIAGKIYNTHISGMNPIPSGTGLQIKVISTTSTGEIYGIIDKFEITNIGSGYDTVVINAGGGVIELLNPTDGTAFQGTKQKYILKAHPSDSFKESFRNGFDGSRYFLSDLQFSGFCASTEFQGASSVSYDINNYDETYTKRTRDITLEISPGFSTPDNVADILTDQLHNPNKISNSNNTAPYINYEKFDMSHVDVGNDLLDEFSPVIIDTPTYTPTVCNASLSGNKNGDQNSFTQIRQRFYSTVAWKDPERIDALNFFNTGYHKTPRFSIDMDIMTGRTTTNNYTGVGGNNNLGDFPNTECGEFGNHVVLLNTFKNTDHGANGNLPGSSNKAELVKHGLIMTNLKYTKRNIEALAASFKKAEKYIGDQSVIADSTSEDYRRKLGLFLDIGMYDDEFSQQGVRALTTEDPPQKMTGTKIKFATKAEAIQYGFLEKPTDHNKATGLQVELNGYQPDFNNVKNDGQLLGGVWIKTRFQEGFKFNGQNTDGIADIPNYSGDRVPYRQFWQGETGFAPFNSFFNMDENFNQAGYEDITFKSFFNSTYNTTETGFSGSKSYDEYIKLSVDNDIAAIPVFARHEGNLTFVKEADLTDATPFIAFVSAFEIGDHNPDNFDPVGLIDNSLNKWVLDTNNSIFGTKIGLDKSFTRNSAVQLYNPQFNLSNENRATGFIEGSNYINYMYVGAVNPSINFNPSFSRFEIQGLNTPISEGNGLLTDLPNNFIANDAPETLNIQINRKGTIISSTQKNRGNGNINPKAISNFETQQKQGSILDSQSGIAIEELSLFDENNNSITLSNNDYSKFTYCMLDKMGFELNQILPLIGNAQAFFTNPFVYQNKTENYLKTYSNILKPITTGAYISSAEIQTLSLNELNAPTFDLGGDSLRQTKPDISQGAITAFKLPSKLDIPYLVVYSSILQGGVDTTYIGGSDGFSKIPAITYLTRDNNQSDFFYSPSPNFNFTATKDFTITEIETSIRLPDGSRPKLESHSAIIYKITKPIRSLQGSMPSEELKQKQRSVKKR